LAESGANCSLITVDAHLAIPRAVHAQAGAVVEDEWSNPTDPRAAFQPQRGDGRPTVDANAAAVVGPAVLDVDVVEAQQHAAAEVDGAALGGPSVAIV
jgi:hypothetical protein